ncbi:MAG: hypothetical protein NC388_02700 [Clostridium sp.]|nr:hypothetical protein [Clostridium sp.]
MEILTIPNREIATMAFDRLRRERKTDAAIRLAASMLHSAYISLGISDVDWDIDCAIQKCGGEPRTVHYGYTARFHFSRDTEMSEHRYRSIIRDIYGE